MVVFFFEVVQTFSERMDLFSLMMCYNYPFNCLMWNMFFNMLYFIFKELIGSEVSVNSLEEVSTTRIKIIIYLWWIYTVLNINNSQAF